ncbi:MAG TPA: MipA/OmpV family protein [Thermoanaerobaculia bacterium]|nr:MipA/OmpV family protein [Thermoanaerobaculia bacterium]
MRYLLLVSSLPLLLLAPAAGAQETTPSPATTGTSFGPQGFGASDGKPRFSAGVAVISSARPYAGTDNRVMIVPSLGVEWGDFYLRGIYAGWRFAKTKGFSADVQARWRFTGLEPEDSPALTGMEERKGSLDLGLDLSWRSRWFGVKLLPVTDVLGRSRGQEVAAEVFTMIPAGPVRVSPFVGGSWLSASHVDYYYGVKPGEATASRPAYEGPATWNWNAGLGVSANAGRVFLQGVLRYQWYGDGITGSPIVDQEGAFGAVLISTYRF